MKIIEERTVVYIALNREPRGALTNLESERWRRTFCLGGLLTLRWTQADQPSHRAVSNYCLVATTGMLSPQGVDFQLIQSPCSRILI